MPFRKVFLRSGLLMHRVAAARATDDSWCTRGLSSVPGMVPRLRARHVCGGWSRGCDHTLVGWWPRCSSKTDCRRREAERAICARADGRGVYFKARDGHSIWWLPLSETGDAAGDPQPTGLPLTGAAIQHLTMSPDGRRVGWTVLEQTANIWSVSLGSDATEPAPAAFPLTDGSGVRYGLPAVSADGRVVMVGSRPGSASGLFLLEPGTSLRQPTPDSPGRGSPRWMPGDQEIAYITDRGEGPGFWAIGPSTGKERLLFPFCSTSAGRRRAANAERRSPEYRSVCRFHSSRICVRSQRRSKHMDRLAEPFGADREPDAADIRDAGGHLSKLVAGRTMARLSMRRRRRHTALRCGCDCRRARSVDSWTWTELDRRVVARRHVILIAARRKGIWNVGAVSRHRAPSGC